MTRPILNLAELEFHDWGQGERFQARIGQIGRRIGAKQLGYNVTVLPPGKSAFPFHSHSVNEEMFFVLEGAGEIRIGEERHPVRAGDVIACPAGGAETAHQIINTSTAELRFLAVSMNLSPELSQYPDSGKFGVWAEFPHGPDGGKTSYRFITRQQASAEDYWDGE